jgi:uncharacterized integral membrane protein
LKHPVAIAISAARACAPSPAIFPAPRSAARAPGSCIHRRNLGSSPGRIARSLPPPHKLRLVEEREQHFERTWQPRLWISLALLVLIVAYLIAFVVGNDERARVDFVFGAATTSLIWVILLALLAGLLGGVLLSQLYGRRRAYRREASSETPSSISDGDS